MNAEDSYEGAVQRLRRLGYAGVAVEPAPAATAADEQHEDLRGRVQDLEELATMACNENERLERELAEARGRIAALQQLVATLQQSLAGRDEGDADEALDIPKRKGPRYVALLLLVGAGAAALVTLRPWERRYSPATVASPAEPAAATVAPPTSVTPTPATTPTSATPTSATPTSATPAATAAKPEPGRAAPVTPAVHATPAPTIVPKLKIARHAAAKRHHAKRKHAGKHHAASEEAANGDDAAGGGDDPLAGLAR